MSLSLQQINHIGELDSLVESGIVERREMCLVGSSILAVRGLRENYDIDICLMNRNENIEAPTINLSNNRYTILGLSDHDIVTDPQFHDELNGYKFVRPEIEYSLKRIRKWEKDKKDLQILEQYREETDDWNPELERHDYTPGPKHLAERGVHSFRENGVRETIGHGVQYLRWHGPGFLPFNRSDSEYSGQPTTIPGKALMSIQEDGLKRTAERGVRLVKLKEPTGLVDRYSRLRHKAKLGTLTERKLELLYPTATLLTDQYDDDGSFTRFDVVVRLLAAEALVKREDVPVLVRTFEQQSNRSFLKDLKHHVDQYAASGMPPDVPVGYDSTILDPNALAVALVHHRESVPVSIRSGSGSETFDREWFETSAFTDDDRQTIDEAFSELLYDSNTLFPAILWPPAQEHFDEIVNQIRGEKRVHLVKKIEIPDEEFGDFVWALYESQQDLNPDHIDEKVERMDGYEKTIRVVGYEVPDPRIREGFSNEVLQMKERVREAFTPRIVTDNPSANLIIHSTDNYDHNKETWEIIEEYSHTPIETEWGFSSENRGL